MRLSKIHKLFFWNKKCKQHPWSPLDPVGCRLEPCVPLCGPPHCQAAVRALWLCAPLFVVSNAELGRAMGTALAQTRRGRKLAKFTSLFSCGEPGIWFCDRRYGGATRPQNRAPWPPGEPKWLNCPSFYFPCLLRKTEAAAHCAATTFQTLSTYSSS